MSFSAARESRIWHAPRIVGACRISKRLDGWLGRLAVDRDCHGAANWTEGLKNSRTPEGVLRPRVKDPRGGHAPASGCLARIRRRAAKVNIFLREFTFPHAVVSDSCAGASRRPRRGGRRRRHRGGKRRCDLAGVHEALGFQGGGMLENESGASPKEGPAAQELQPLGVFSAEPPRRFSSPLGRKPMGECDGIYRTVRPTASPLGKFGAAPGVPPRRCGANPLPPGSRSRSRIRFGARLDLAAGSRDSSTTSACRMEETFENESGASPKEGPAAQELQPLGVFAAEPPRRLSNPADRKSTGGVMTTFMTLSAWLQALFQC